MLKQAKLVRPLQGQAMQCRVCEHYCTLKPGEWGKCGVRTNRDGQLYLIVYENAVAAHVDPIEKKPLFHFLPGSSALSIGTYGCNMRCQWCQNWQISQVRDIDWEDERRSDTLSPSKLVDIARTRKIASIAYTYNEPTVFFEYTYDTAKLAHEQGIKNVYVSNGFMSEESLEEIAPYLDGINVDLKGFTEELYSQYTGARLDIIKRNIAKIAQDTAIWLEVTTLVIPGLNDSDTEFRAMAEWLYTIDPTIPWHLSAFHPSYRMLDRPRPPTSTLIRAHDIGKSVGLQYIYLGNVLDPAHEGTQCPTCGTALIQRYGYDTQTLWKTSGVCPQCKTKIPGVWH